MSEDKTRCAELNYRAEYERKCQELSNMEKELRCLRAELDLCNVERERASAKLEMVYLIFGGYNR